MAISGDLTFTYEFTVQKCDLSEPNSPDAGRESCWSGQGSGKAAYGPSGGIAGPRPRFELSAGWITLFPCKGSAPSLLARSFSDIEGLRHRNSDAALWRDARHYAVRTAANRSRQGERTFVEAMQDAMKAEVRLRGLIRDVASYSVFSGEALENVFRIGDEFRFSRDGNGDFYCSVRRNSETVFSAGSVGWMDYGGPIEIWQEHDRHPNPNVEALRKRMPNVRVAEFFDVHRPYVTVRLKGQTFQLLDGQEVFEDPYYVFLARSNRNVPHLAYEFTPRAVHSAGRLDLLDRDLIIDAARRLMAPKTRLL
jgi:hypothetical protein